MQQTFGADNWQQRLLWMLVWSAILIILGYFIPRLYIQYIDPREYIHILQDISFDRKVYAPCDTATAKVTAQLDVNSAVETNTRMMKVQTDRQPPDNFQIISNSHSKGFVIAQPTPQVYTVDYPIACDLPDGVYMWRAETTYKVSGIEKVEPFQTTLITVDHTEKILRPHNLTLKQIEEMQNQQLNNAK